MRTTLDIPEKLIREAMELTGARTKSQLIREALEAQVQQIKRKRLLTFKGAIDLDSVRKRKDG
ncbi:type II toxin-antitoxin system VapB family antitoxin [Echinicola strongylocentroti]|uniref:Type II toxin-antitoxin system VapB family antitoxin n=1 Tax=Echinicola strongylocentroti TaxID=1795355 RepID=A0A2Z4IMN9_9BACT|nr:type II toxin-antitoxin system VapB family antitoxin [Echinicola strongylocentroti]AWW31653.1 type II toxin-antitoxin system VapB family antitoxin [Echinicola strongylocentroti]